MSVDHIKNYIGFLRIMKEYPATIRENPAFFLVTDEHYRTTRGNHAFLNLDDRRDDLERWGGVYSALKDIEVICSTTLDGRAEAQARYTRGEPATWRVILEAVHSRLAAVEREATRLIRDPIGYEPQLEPWKVESEIKDWRRRLPTDPSGLSVSQIHKRISRGDAFVVRWRRPTYIGNLQCFAYYQVRYDSRNKRWWGAGWHHGFGKDYGTYRDVPGLTARLQSHGEGSRLLISASPKPESLTSAR